MVGADYFEIRIPCTADPALSDLLTAMLAEIGAESFTEEDDLLLAYIPSDQYDADAVNALMASYAPDLNFEATLVPGTNWNATWEAQFEPVEVNERCRIRAPFHEAANDHRLEIIIEPRMSFGTGHHATTWLMCNAMYAFEPEFRNQDVLDMGCGTGVLGILACKLGASKVLGIDIESWACDNAVDNAAANQVSMELRCGDVTAIPDAAKYHVILANINRNVLEADGSIYNAHLTHSGLLFLSGFLLQDEARIHSVYEALGLVSMYRNESNGWMCLGFQKP
jgi:ribosomal protein L11 methyltransferase